MNILLTVSSEATATELTTVFENALNGINTQFMDYIGIALPIGLGMFAVYFAIRKGLQFFKGVTA